jgi:hypothetical protein
MLVDFNWWGKSWKSAVEQIGFYYMSIRPTEYRGKVHVKWQRE